MTTYARGRRTRQRIVERAAPVFNRRGFAGASMAELVRATGVEKGGIYNHFGSKETLALETFDYAIGLITESFTRAQAGRQGLDRLVGIIERFARDGIRPTVPGGCPIMNTAVEADDTNPALAAAARAAMDSWHRLVGAIVKESKALGELDDDVDPYALATVVTSTLEGALAITNLMGDEHHMRRAVAFLVDHVESLRRTP